jgi:3-amino-5-hydroxybenzoic acid synthesis related protein
MLRAVVFDLDGVLIDSEPLMRFAFEVCYRNLIGNGPVPIEAYLEHMGESFPRIMDHLGLPHDMWGPYRKLCQEHIDRINVFPEGRILLKRLRGMDLKLAVLTGKDRIRTLHTLEYFGLNQDFHEVIASDQLKYPKPDPEGIVLAADLLGVSTTDMVMIGDSVSDILCAQQADVTSIAVTWGIKPERVQTLCRPDLIARDWDQLTDILFGLAREPAGVLRYHTEPGDSRSEETAPASLVMMKQAINEA